MSQRILSARSEREKVHAGVSRTFLTRCCCRRSEPLCGLGARQVVKRHTGPTGHQLNESVLQHGMNTRVGRVELSGNINVIS